jgi:hypothetical protein
MKQPSDHWVPSSGGVGRTRGSRRRSSKGVGYGNILAENPPDRFFPVVVDHVHLRRHTMSLLRLRPSSGLRNVLPRPKGGSSHTGLVDG